MSRKKSRMLLSVNLNLKGVLKRSRERPMFWPMETIINYLVLDKIILIFSLMNTSSNIWKDKRRFI